mmetsp:Transcript_10102/g.29837  ORF Transcript_10102/g.29837 Transcript_10102/m.29837 type:complete len:224 (+) Transcript_10102:1355-2026(+)
MEGHVPLVQTWLSLVLPLPGGLLGGSGVAGRCCGRGGALGHLWRCAGTARPALACHRRGVPARVGYWQGRLLLAVRGGAQRNAVSASAPCASTPARVVRGLGRGLGPRADDGHRLAPVRHERGRLELEHAAGQDAPEPVQRGARVRPPCHSDARGGFDAHVRAEEVLAQAVAPRVRGRGRRPRLRQGALEEAAVLCLHRLVGRVIGRPGFNVDRHQVRRHVSS